MTKSSEWAMESCWQPGQIYQRRSSIARSPPAIDSDRRRMHSPTGRFRAGVSTDNLCRDTNTFYRKGFLMSQLRVAIHGAAGRMGQRLVACVHHDADLKLVAALDSPKCPRLGEDAGEVAGCGKTGTLIASELSTPVDVVIDFSVPEATEHLVPMCVARKLPLVVATTGFNDAQKAAVQKAAEQIPLVWSPSMSVAVNLLMKLVRDAAPC